jgi:uncharacterized membrane protein YqaE (UPF0057 family)
MRYILAFLFPPIAVLLCGKPIQFLFSIILTIFLYIPGVIHALFVVSNYFAEKRTDKIVRAIDRQSIAYQPDDWQSSPQSEDWS